MICPHCHRQINAREAARELGARGGRSVSLAKLAACRRNAKLGGRPRKERDATVFDLSQDRIIPENNP